MIGLDAATLLVGWAAGRMVLAVGHHPASRGGTRLRLAHAGNLLGSGRDGAGPGSAPGFELVRQPSRDGSGPGDDGPDRQRCSGPAPVGATQVCRRCRTARRGAAPLGSGGRHERDRPARAALRRRRAGVLTPTRPARRAAGPGRRDPGGDGCGRAGRPGAGPHGGRSAVHRGGDRCHAARTLVPGPARSGPGPAAADGAGLGPCSGFPRPSCCCGLRAWSRC